MKITYKKADEYVNNNWVNQSDILTEEEEKEVNRLLDEINHPGKIKEYTDYAIVENYGKILSILCIGDKL